MEIDRRALIASLGGAAAVSLMGAEAKADALEDFMSHQLDLAIAQQQEFGSNNRPAQPGEKFPTESRTLRRRLSRGSRRGAGNLFVAGRSSGNGHVKRLEPLPEKPTLLDYYKYQFAPANHVPLPECDTRNEERDE